MTSGRLSHGHAKKGQISPTYRAWSSMWTRCTNPHRDMFIHYGGRGITVCPRWQSFDNFLSDMGEKPLGTSLDRVNNNGNYEPLNCRWATPKQQRANSRQNIRLFTHAGKTQCLADWAMDCGIPIETLIHRLDKIGETFSEAIHGGRRIGRHTKRLTIYGETKTISEWAKMSPVEACTIRSRINAGWNHKDAVFGGNIRGVRCGEIREVKRRVKK